MARRNFDEELQYRLDERRRIDEERKPKQKPAQPIKRQKPPEMDEEDFRERMQMIDDLIRPDRQKRKGAWFIASRGPASEEMETVEVERPVNYAGMPVRRFLPEPELTEEEQRLRAEELAYQRERELEQGEGAQFPLLQKFIPKESEVDQEPKVSGKESDLFERVSARIRKLQEQGRLK